MDELKIYIEMKEYDDTGGALPIADVIDNSTRAALNMAKYRIMWMLRKIEDDYIESGGFIVLDMNSGSLRTTGYRFPFKMHLALRYVIPDIILLETPDEKLS